MSQTRIRLSPEARRDQLVELGVRLLATRPLDEVTIDALAEHAGISRGLLYHYFGNKQDFHRAVVGRAASQLYAITAPALDGDPLETLRRSLRGYIAYVRENRPGYVSLVRAANGGDPGMREIYLAARDSLTARMFDADDPAVATLGVRDEPGVRLLVQGWTSMVETTVIDWTADPAGLSESVLADLLVGALVGALAAVPDPGGPVGTTA